MQLHRYQTEARDFLLKRLTHDSGGGLWLEPGLGKTITTLDTILAMHELGQVQRTLVIAPARVIATSWPKEIKNWGIPLKWGWLKGDDEERADVVASKPDIYFVGCAQHLYSIAVGYGSGIERIVFESKDRAQCRIYIIFSGSVLGSHRIC
jgi:hypothetical protein